MVYTKVNENEVFKNVLLSKVKMITRHDSVTFK